MGFLKFFILDSYGSDSIFAACRLCPWTQPVLDVTDTFPLLPLFRKMEDHYYEDHGASS